MCALFWFLAAGRWPLGGGLWLWLCFTAAVHFARTPFKHALSAPPWLWVDPIGPRAKGRQKNKTKNNVRAYFIRPGIGLDARTISRFFYRVFEFPLSINAQKRDKQNRMGEIIRRTTPQNIFYHVFEFPLPRGA